MEANESKFNIKGTIADIKKAREEYLYAAERFRIVSAPVLQDMRLIPTLYEWFCELASKTNGDETVRQVYGLFPDVVSGGALPVERRKQFIFVILYLYSPRRVFSGKMPNGLRRAICRTLGIGASTVISDNANDVLSRYNFYKTWARDVDSILEEILNRIYQGQLRKQYFYDKDGFEGLYR